MQLLRINCWKFLTHGLNHRTALARQLCTVVENSEWQKPDSKNVFDTGITVYNCVHRGNVPFIIRNAKCLTWYTCGPTVYDDAHIGHAVCYMKCDIIQRILRNYFHLNVITAMNITDIDDKIIARSPIVNLSANELANKYEQSFWHDIDALGIQRADIIIRVTEFVPQIIAFIEKLLAKDGAYVAADGSVYFANPRTNGKLQNIESSTADNRSKLPTESLAVRRSSHDFALWKAAKAGEPQWNVPWKYDTDATVSTAGRPGWHSECAAMATELFGNTIDVHAGGIDLKFPHHENEEAQCCAYHNRKQWANYWFHIGHLVTTDNIKMSKSLKNVVSIKEFLKHYSRDQLRMACLLSTYHQHIEFSDDILLQAGDILKRFVSFFDDTERILQNVHDHRISNRDEIVAAIHLTAEKIDRSLKNDFDTKTCIGSLMELITVINRSINPKHLKDTNMSPASEAGNGLDIIKSGQNVVRQFVEAVGFQDIIASSFSHKNAFRQENAPDSSRQIPAENLINDIMTFRTKLLNDAKSSKDNKLFEISDQLRSIFRQNGLIIKDHGSTSSWQFDSLVTRKNQSKK